MRKRSLSREIALQVLYQMDITHDPLEQSWDGFWLSSDLEQIDQPVRDFARDLVKGVSENVAAIDEKISSYARNWELERMAVVDRNILRLGVFELLFRSDIPPKVSINEAVELAKKFSELKSGKFVNGILDKVKSERQP